MEKKYTADELEPKSLTVKLRSHIIRDFQQMEKNTKIPMEDLMTKALLMYIATHNDYLGLRKS